MKIEEFLIDLPSLGPELCMGLLKVAEELKKMIESLDDKEDVKDAKEFLAALLTVCHYSAIHQKVIIERLENIIKRR